MIIIFNARKAPNELYLKQWRTVHHESIGSRVPGEVTCYDFLLRKPRLKRYIAEMFVYCLRIFPVLLNEINIF